ncbi:MULTISPECIES: hypothetical protein [Serratia]|uniref:hypothetical protein n=1 Tax=Serratia TaxID=613 RepID=UPI0012FDCC80|nr:MULTISPECIES: hypothetical protein [Serratia]WEO91703.1 hypothetical protein JET59_011055 [Serratia proteamaculans]
MEFKKSKTAYYIAACVIIGFIISYYLSCRYFSADADVINSSITWVEIQKYGLSVMKTWYPTTDNWYFAIYPIHYLVFWIFGGSSILILNIIAATQVTLCSLVTSLIAYKITKRKTSFLLIIFYSSLSYFTYTVGFISHPFSHNAINLYGLICIYIHISFKNKKVLCFSISFLSLLASISDPWFVAAYLLPLFLHSLYSKINKEESWLTPLMYLLVLVLFFSGAIQKLLNLPVDGFHLANVDVIVTNAKWFVLDLGRMMNLFFVENPSNYFTSSIAIFCFFSFTIWGRKDSINFLLLLSILGIASSFVIGLPEKMEYSARFLVNIIYLVPLVIFITTHKKLAPISGLFFALTFSSAIYSHTLHTESNHDRGVKEQIEFMEKNDLTYGYGSYWGTKANTISWMSDGKVIIRPMIVDSSTGRIDWKRKRSQTFDGWYQPLPERTFIAIAPDAETCPKIEPCIDGMKKQFGAPDKTLHYNDITFLVYNKGLK